MTSKLATSRLATLMPIRKMKRAIKFYVKVLGGKLEGQAPGEMKDSWASIKLGPNTIWLIAPEKREKRKLAYSTFLVKDIRATVKELKGRGVRFEKAARGSPQTKIEGPIAIEPFGAAAFFKDSEGNLLMVWQNFPAM
jgi:predicted enzyme related to lactoylglutathione lyase